MASVREHDVSLMADIFFHNPLLGKMKNKAFFCEILQEILQIRVNQV